MADYAKLKDLEVLNISAADGVSYVKWEDGQMKRSDSPMPGYRADYKFVLANGSRLSLSEAQLSAVLLAAYDGQGKADVVGREFSLKHNIVRKKFPDGEKDVTLTDFKLISTEEPVVNTLDDLPNF